MTPEEIRAEVERRKQRARDLKIREILWDLEKSFRSYRYWLREDPQFALRLVYPGIELYDDGGRFSIGQQSYQLSYDKGDVSSEDYGGINYDTTRGTLILKVDRENAFEFEVDEIMECHRDSPLFRDSLGKITRFIEGPWVSETADFVERVKAHERSAWKERNAPRETQEAEDLRKRFGL